MWNKLMDSQFRNVSIYVFANHGHRRKKSNQETRLAIRNVTIIIVTWNWVILEIHEQTTSSMNLLKYMYVVDARPFSICWQGLYDKVLAQGEGTTFWGTYQGIFVFISISDRTASLMLLSKSQNFNLRMESGHRHAASLLGEWLCR